MGRGPTRQRIWGDLGLQASQTLAGVALGGGVHNNIRRTMARRTARSSSVPAELAGGDLTIQTFGSTTGTDDSYVEFTLTAGVWVCEFEGNIEWPDPDTGVPQQGSASLFVGGSVLTSRAVPINATAIQLVAVRILGGGAGSMEMSGGPGDGQTATTRAVRATCYKIA